MVDRQVWIVERFEGAYRAYVEEAERLEEERTWTKEETAKRKRKLLEKAPEVEMAMREAGVVIPVLASPGGAVMARDLAGLLFYHGPIGLNESGFAIQHKLLELFPQTIGALKLKQARQPKQAMLSARTKGFPLNETKRVGNFDTWQEMSARQAAREEEKRVREEEEPPLSKRALRWMGTRIEKIVIGVVIGVIVVVISVYLINQGDSGGNSQTGPQGAPGKTAP
jgi:hypothetical protein